MKKLIYSLAIALIGMTSCTSFDEEKSETYAAGPTVDLSLTTTTDSTFTFTVKPAEGSNFYSYTVVPGKANTSVSAESVLKNSLSGSIEQGIIEYAKTSSVTVNMRDAKDQPLCVPNTTYTVYAVASSAQGVVGAVKTLEVTTTDGEAPVLMPYTATDPTSETDTVTTVSFSEEVMMGEGTVSASYYQEYGDGNLVSIPEDDIFVATHGKNVYFAVNNVPAGAYVLYSWTEGAFVDSYGNKCPATNTEFTEEGISGVYRRLPFETWSIKDKNFSPEAGSLISDYKTFKGTITFDQNVFRNDELVETGDITLVYTGSKKTSTIALTPSDWSVSGKTLTFTLPEAPAAGDIITIKIKAGTIFDVNGNPNVEYTSSTKTVWWKYFAMTKDMAIGNFSLSLINGVYDVYPTATFTEYAKVENGLVISNLYQEGSQVLGTYDLNAGEVYVKAYYELGTVTTSKGNTYGLITYSLSGSDDIAFTVNADGTMESTDFAVVACDADFTEALGYWDKPDKTVFSPVASSAKGKVSAAKKSYAKSSIKKVNVKVNPRSLKTLRK